MKKTLTRLAALLLFCPVVLKAQLTPEVLYYTFDGTGTSVPNLASNPPAGTATATIMGGETQTSSGICGGALVGTGQSSTNDYMNTGWVTNMSGSWTISFRTSNVPSTTSTYYILGDVNAGGLRVFTGGVANPGNWILRGPLTDTYATGGASTGPSMTTFVYDAVTNTITSYVNGVQDQSVLQPAGGVSLFGSGPFKVGGYSSSACLPGGSITGAPKIRAMEIIAELEGTRRGAYCGAMGWIGFDGGLDTSIVIRTCTVRDGTVAFSAGGGVVADSDPAAEYEETLAKARGMFAALAP